MKTQAGSWTSRCSVLPEFASAAACNLIGIKPPLVPVASLHEAPSTSNPQSDDCEADVEAHDSTLARRRRGRTQFVRYRGAS